MYDINTMCTSSDVCLPATGPLDFWNPRSASVVCHALQKLWQSRRCRLLFWNRSSNFKTGFTFPSNFQKRMLRRCRYTSDRGSYHQLSKFTSYKRVCSCPDDKLIVVVCAGPGLWTLRLNFHLYFVLCTVSTFRKACLGRKCLLTEAKTWLQDLRASLASIVGI